MAKTPSPKEPKDLGLRVGTKRQQDLERIRRGLVEETEHCGLTIDLNKEFVKTIERLIRVEKENFK